MWTIDQLACAPPSQGIKTVYVSPLKALVYDVERNLRVPLAGVAQAAELSGMALTLPQVGPPEDRSLRHRAPCKDWC